MGDDGTHYLRAKNGQLRRRDPVGRWVCCVDPDRPAKDSSIRRTARLQRTKQGLPNNPPGHRRGRGLVPFADGASVEEKLRIKLRTTQRKISKQSGDAPTELVTLPGVSGLSFATRYIDGGRKAFIEFVQLAVLERHAVAVRWWEVFADLPTYEREIVSYDDVCAAAGIKPSELMAVVVSTVMDLGRDAANLVAAMTHPAVVSAMTKSAARIDGPHAEIAFKDRIAFLQGQGVLPVPKGMQLHIHASANAQAAAAASTEPSVPSFTRDLEAVRTVRQLTASAEDTALFEVRDNVAVAAAVPVVPARPVTTSGPAFVNRLVQTHDDPAEGSGS